jgi:glycosidase
MTLRGIPSLYYGTEILMKGFSNPDGLVRSDFEGGWKADNQDRFTDLGRNDAENRAFDYVRKLARWRAGNTAVHNGKLMQFIPEKGLYTFCRYDAKNTVLIIVNASNDAAEWNNAEKTDEVLKGKRSGTDIISGKIIGLNSLPLQPWDIKIVEVSK